MAAPDLTTRQLDVLRGIAAGKSSKQIARDLGVSPRTVEVHTAALFQRLSVNRRAQAMPAAVALGLIPEPATT